MYKLIIRETKTRKTVEESVFQDEDEAMAYYYELVMRQNYGEAQLEGKDFTVVFPNAYFDPETFYPPVKESGMNINFTLAGRVNIAKKFTSKYAENHVGRNSLEKECIKKGYLVKKYGEIFKDCIESEKNKTGIFALDFNTCSHKGEFILI